MTTDFPQLADFLQNELRRFFHIVQQTTDATVRQAAAAQLQATVSRVEPLLLEKNNGEALLNHSGGVISG